ncbi:MAG: SIMPL domain-containing protein [Candidatus Adlerbacteria bacterium]|nr:SIMPL domain-containing protein [Candidatus Adlerbacteria bacterium]
MHLKGLVDYAQPLVAAGTVLSLAFVISVGIGAYTSYQIKVESNTIEVTGSAKESVVSDFGRWTINLTTATSVDNQQVGFDRLENASKHILAYLAGQGFANVETPAPVVDSSYIYPEKSAPILTGYTVSRQIIVSSADIDKLSVLAGSVAPLSGFGYNVTTNSVELTYQKLPEERVVLLSGAIKDAQARAEAIAKETGRSVGALKSATGGVVQVLPKGGVDISDSGMYDTSNKNKDVMVTVRASFILK